MRALSLRARLTLVYLAAVALTFAVVSLAVRQALQARLTSALDQELQRGAASAALVTADVGLDNAAELSRRLNSASPADVQASESADLASALFLVTVWTPGGKPVAAVPAGLEQLLALQPNGTRTVSAAGLALRVYTTTLPSGVHIQAAEPASRVSGPIAEVRRTTLFVGAAVLPLVLALNYWLAGRGLKPLEDVSAFAAQVRAGDLRRRLQGGRRPPEVQRLADAFDAMLARLDLAFSQQRRFIGDVSHELRTPLTALRGGIDVLLMTPDLRPETREQLEEMSAECARLVNVTQNLLGLAQAETGRVPITEPVELEEVCFEAVRQARLIRPDVTVDVTRFAPVVVSGDAALLSRMIVNLLDNAVHVSREGGAITLALSQSPAGARIDIHDAGPGIAAEEMPHLFERFYSGRARRGRGGMGLGLAIVRWIATAHGGDVVATNDPSGGAVFTVTLPAASGRGSHTNGAEPGALQPRDAGT